jgi:hypothetical protein
MVYRISITLFFILNSLLTYAQKNDNNPYSRYGLGQLSDRNFAHLRQMGGLGSSYLDVYHINFVNPASYAFLNSTAFDIGFFAKNTTLTDANMSNSFWSGNLDYLSLAFPIFNPINDLYDNAKRDLKIGMNFTLRSNSNTNYNISVADSLENIGNFDRVYQGTGGTYNFTWGNAIRYKNFSFGTNLGFVFGKLSRESNIIYPNSEFAYNVVNSSSYNVRGFVWDAGMLYSTVLNKKELKENKNLTPRRLTAGFNFTTNNRFNTTSDVNNVLIQQLPGSIINIDTILNEVDKKGKGRTGAEYGLGATYYYGEKAALGFNISGALWSKYFNEAVGEKEGFLANSTRYSLGGYYRPNYKSIDNFFERVYYRYGFYYENEPLVIDTKQLNSYGVTFGFGLPVVYQRKISHVNLSFNLGERGKGTAIEERFAKVTLGVTFNDDQWFLKSKYY